MGSELSDTFHSRPQLICTVGTMALFNSDFVGLEDHKEPSGILSSCSEKLQTPDGQHAALSVLSPRHYLRLGSLPALLTHQAC